MTAVAAGARAADAPLDIAPAGRAARAKHWVPAYLVAATALAPVVVPAGPGQTAIGDALNITALAVFMLTLRRGSNTQLPLLTAVLLIAIGSLLASTAAVSLGAVGLALAQDVYLYTWFAVLACLMRGMGGLRPVRIAWLWTANVIALLGLGLLPRGGLAEMSSLVGPRAVATFPNPNYLADYLGLGVLNALGLMAEMRMRWILPSLALLMAAMVATKSNGGCISLAAGLAAWGVARAATRGTPSWLGGLVALVLAVTLATGWLVAGSGSPPSWAREMLAHTYAGRLQKSTNSRETIWRGLGTELSRSPLGIGPGNSAVQQVPIGMRERPDSFIGKESHSDYVAYAAERGPIGFAGLMLAAVTLFTRVIRSRDALRLRTGSERTAVTIQAALLGALVLGAVHSLVIERLHFRHMWLFVAMLWALTERPPGLVPALPRGALPERRAVPARRVAESLGSGNGVSEVPV